MLAPICMVLKPCVICQGTMHKYLKNRPYHLVIPVDYFPMKSLSVDIKLCQMVMIILNIC